MLENVPSSTVVLPSSSSTASTEPLLLQFSDDDQNQNQESDECFNHKYKSYKYNYNNKSTILTIMWRQKRIYLIKIFKFIIFSIIMFWIYFTYQNFYKSYFSIKDDYDYSSPSASSPYDSIYGPIPNYIEWEEYFNNDKIDKFNIKFKDLNLTYFFYRDEKLFCNNTKLLIVIPSRPNAFNTRMAIRKSWLRNLTSSVTYRFIIGATSNSTIRRLNHEEFGQYNDLIISNIHDSYLNLTLKTYSILQWQQFYCPKIEFILKTDDDTVIDVNRLQYFIETDYKNISSNFDNKVIFGKIWTKVLPKRKPSQKWYTPYEAWNQRFFPDYCNGPTYLLTAKSAELILNQSENHNLITIEDVLFTGILAEAAGIKRIDRWKSFGQGKIIDTKIYGGCDERNVPYLTSIYGIESQKLNYEDGKSNAFSKATEKLQALKC